jgi:hypothetical protein
MDNLPQTGPQKAVPPRLVLRDYIPKTVLDGIASPEEEQKYEIVILPPIVIRTGGGIH